MSSVPGRRIYVHPDKLEDAKAYLFVELQKFLQPGKFEITSGRTKDWNCPYVTWKLKE